MGRGKIKIPYSSELVRYPININYITVQYELHRKF